MMDWGGEWLPKAFVYGGLFVAVGVAVARWLLDSASVRADAAITRRLEQISIAGACAALIALLLRALFHTAAAFEWSGAFSWENFRLVAMESRWGGSWQLQLCGAVLVIVAAITTRRWSAGRFAYVVAVGALMLSVPVLGHGAGSWARYLLHTIHIAAGAVWLGSLAVLVSLHPSRGTAAAPLLARFSPLALTASTIVAVSGVIAAVLYVASVHNLLTSGYGQILLLKIACVAFVAACGALNWRRVRAGETPSSSVMIAEVLAAVVVVVVTSVLTETEHP